MPDLDNAIAVYGTTWCPDCVRAKRVLESQGVEYRWINIEKDPQAAQMVQEMNQGMRSVPTIVFPDGSILVEPSNAELLRSLGETSAKR